jgi:hypothetical protein
MAKIKVNFKPVRKSEGDWAIIAEYPGAEAREITGFTSKADIDDWMNGASDRLAPITGLREVTR